MGGAPALSSLSHMMGAATSLLRPDPRARESRCRPMAGPMGARPALANRAFRRASAAAMPVAHGPHIMLLATTPVYQNMMFEKNLPNAIRSMNESQFPAFDATYR